MTGVAVSISDMDYDKQRAVMGALGAGAQFGVLMPFSRKHESEADDIGLHYMARAGYDPRESIRFWERMEESADRSHRNFFPRIPLTARAFSNWKRKCRKRWKNLTLRQTSNPLVVARSEETCNAAAGHGRSMSQVGNLLEHVNVRRCHAISSLARAAIRIAIAAAWPNSHLIG